MTRSNREAGSSLDPFVTLATIGQPTGCLFCQGQLLELGSLGSTLWARCDDCGLTQIVAGTEEN
jgi:hypothetical protein